MIAGIDTAAFFMGTARPDATLAKILARVATNCCSAGPHESRRDWLSIYKERFPTDCRAESVMK